MKKTIIFLLVFLTLTGSVTVLATAESPIEITAPCGVLMDAESCTVLYEKQAHKKCYPASVTKIMSMLIVVEAIDSGKIKLTDKVTASADAAAKGGSQIWLREGETMTVDELLRACAIASANDACCALGEYIAGSEQSFVSMMNERAAQLGMKDTVFENCSGLDDDTTEHLTTAYDIALMSAELLKHEIIMQYSQKWMDSLRGGETQLVNTNKLVRFYEGTTGLKTGTTSKAGCCVSASAKRNGLHLIAVVMGAATSNDRFEDAKKMLNYGFSEYVKLVPEIKNEDLKEIRVLNGEKRFIKTKCKKVEGLVINKSLKDNVTYTIEIPEYTQAPVTENQKLGEVIFYAGEKEIFRASVTAAENDEKKSLLFVLMQFLKSYGKFT